MQKKKKKSQTNKQNEIMKLKKLACTLPNQSYFQYFIFLFFYITPFFLTSQLVHSLFIFFFLLFSHPHTSSHTPRFLLLSVLNFLSSLSFYVVFLFLLLFFLYVRLLQQFNLSVLHLIWLFSTSHSSFSPWLFCFALFFL